MTNAQPPLLLASGLPLPKSAELPDRSPDGGATADGSPEAGATADGDAGAVLTTGAGLGGGGGGWGGWDVAGATLAGPGAGTEET
jgi:hypothetical protein